MADPYLGAPVRPDYTPTTNLFQAMQRFSDADNYEKQLATNDELRNLALVEQRTKGAEFQQNAPTRVLEDLANQAKARGTISTEPGIANALNATNRSTIAKEPSATSAAIQANLDSLDASKQKKVKEEADIVARWVPVVNESPMEAQGHYQDMLDALNKSGINTDKYQKQWTPDYGRRLTGLRRAAVQTIKHTQEMEKTKFEQEQANIRNREDNAAAERVARERLTSERAKEDKDLNLEKQAIKIINEIPEEKWDSGQRMTVQIFRQKLASSDPVIQALKERIVGLPYIDPKNREEERQNIKGEFEERMQELSGSTGKPKVDYSSADDVKAAYKAGTLSKDQATGILQKKFGYK